MRVTVVGGGNSAHILIPMLAAAGHEVSLLTHRPDDWQQVVRAEYRSSQGELRDSICGRLTCVSSVAEEVIPSAQVIILCMPVAHYREALYEVGPYVNRGHEVFMGTIYGQAGFNWMVEDVKRRFGLEGLCYFAYGLIPWIARTARYGELGITYGSKKVNVVAVHPAERFGELKLRLLDDICLRWFGTGEVRQAENFISLTLSVDNQIIHPTRCYGLYTVCPQGWNDEACIPYFYRDYDELSARYLQRLDDDYSAIRKALRTRYDAMKFTYMLDYLDLEHLSYRSVSPSIRESFVHSQTLTGIRTPVREYSDGHWELDRGHRFFSDDIGYGICIAKWFAQELGVGVPMINELLHWVEAFKGQRYLTEDERLDFESADLTLGFVSGIPSMYGLETLDDVMQIEECCHA